MSYRFLPHARRALAAGLTQKDDGSPLPARGGVPVVLAVNDLDAPSVAAATRGPGDVRGVDVGAITRLEPVRGTRNHPPNQMAVIEFGAPDFPWLFTPARPNDQNRLTPWLVLVVVEDRPEVGIDVVPGRPLPALSIRTPAAVAEELPDLQEAWAWAHAQIVRGPDDTRSDTEILDGHPTGRLSRLIAPRRLAPEKTYHACLVPSFEQGRLAGLGDPVDDTETLRPAWTAGAGGVTLPLYFHWTFSTGERGDFESLARELKPRAPPAQAAGRPTYVGAMHPGISLNAQDGDGVLALPGALRLPGAKAPALADVPSGVKDALPGILDAPKASEADGAANTIDPLSPPLYGRWHIRQHVVPDTSPRWFRALNLDPRNRAAAALGAEVVRRRQEEFMQAAWEQVGDILRVNLQLDLARIGGALLTRLFEKHVLPMPVADLLKFSAPVHGLVGAENRSVLRLIDVSSLPSSLTGQNARRLTSAQNIARKIAVRNTALADSKLNQASKTIALAAAPEFDADPLGLAYDGIAGSRFDKDLDLSQPQVDLSGIGFAMTLERAEITRLRTAGKALEATPVKALELREDIGEKGFFDDGHIRRIRSVSGEKSLNAAVESFVKSAGLHRGTVGFRIDPGARSLMFRPLDVAGGNRVVERPTGAGASSAAARPLGRLSGAVLSGSAIAAELERQPAGRLDPPAAGGRVRTITPRAPGTEPAVRPDASTVIRPLIIDATGLRTFRATANAHLADLNARRVASPPKPAALHLTEVGALIARETRPSDVIANRNRARIGAFGTRFSFDQNDRADDLGIVEEADRILVGPSFPRPLFRDLAEFAPDRFLPGIGEIAENSIVVLETNPAFVEAFLVGSNTEMMREFFWRGFPTDRRATVFNRFWDRPDGAEDIPDIHKWASRNALGNNGAKTRSELVLLLRGELIRRYPGAVLYAVPATDGRKLPAGLAGAMTPVFSGKLDASTLFCGFALAREKALAGNGWFFVLEQQVTEPTFGFDVPGSNDTAVPASWQNATWTHAGAEANEILRVSGGAPLATVVGNAAQLAAVSFQRPFRAAIHADKLIFGGDGAN